METQHETKRDYPAPDDHHRGKPAQEDVRPQPREFGQETHQMDALAKRIDSVATFDRIADRLDGIIDRFDLWARHEIGNGGNAHTVVRPPEWATPRHRPDWAYAGVDTSPEHRAIADSVNRIESSILRLEARSENRDARIEKLFGRLEASLNIMMAAQPRS